MKANSIFVAVLFLFLTSLVFTLRAEASCAASQCTLRSDGVCWCCDRDYSQDGCHYFNDTDHCSQALGSACSDFLPVTNDH